MKIDRLLPLAVMMVLAPHDSNAQSALQTDWSGGGTSGPVTEWGDSFSDCSSIIWTTPGQISLACTGTIICETLDEPREIEASDLDRDGIIDFLVSEPGELRIVWLEGTSEGWLVHPIASFAQAGIPVCIQDLDMDGWDDAIAASSVPGALVWYRNSLPDSSWSAHVIDEYVPNPREIVSADFDLDGDPDVACLSGAGYGPVYWWENLDGSACQWQCRTVYPTTLGADDMCLGDVDGDGDADLAFCSMDLDTLFWLENDREISGVWPFHAIGTVANCRSADLGDIDGDGTSDLCVSTAQGQVWWLDQDGSTPWQAHLAASGILDSRACAAADLDTDGDLDICASGWGTMWAENITGSADLWSTHPLSLDMGGWHLCTADCDQDDVEEIVTSDQYIYGVRWWDAQNPVFCAVGTLESSILDTGSPSEWTSLAWDALIPVGSELGVQVRNDDGITWPLNMEPWSPVFADPDSALAYLTDGRRFVQYKVVMGSPDGADTAVFLQIQLSYASTSIGRECIEVQGNVSVWPNPTNGIIHLNLPADAAAEIAVYSLDGRLEMNLTIDPGPGGSAEADVAELPAGLHLMRVTVCGSTMIEPVILLN